MSNEAPTVPAPPPSPEQVSREHFKGFLASRGLRLTNQRLAIFDAAHALKQHFTAEDLLVQARKRDDSVSRATVYRSLPILTESSLLREIDVGHDNKYYAVCRPSQTFQAQVICADCGKIFEVDAPFMEWYGKTVCEKLGMHSTDQRLQVTATCNSLRDRGSCPQRSKEGGEKQSKAPS